MTTFDPVVIALTANSPAYALSPFVSSTVTREQTIAEVGHPQLGGVEHFPAVFPWRARGGQRQQHRDLCRASAERLRRLGLTGNSGAILRLWRDNRSRIERFGHAAFRLAARHCRRERKGDRPRPRTVDLSAKIHDRSTLCTAGYGGHAFPVSSSFNACYVAVLQRLAVGCGLKRRICFVLPADSRLHQARRPASNRQVRGFVLQAGQGQDAIVAAIAFDNGSVGHHRQANRQRPEPSGQFMYSTMRS